MTCIGGLLDKMTGSVILTAKEVKEVENHIDQLQAENVKLRELCETFGMIANDAICDYYDRDELLVDARELGMEL